MARWLGPAALKQIGDFRGTELIKVVVYLAVAAQEPEPAGFVHVELTHQ